MKAVIDRHPELGLDPEEVTFRFVPKAERPCVRVNLDAGARYEIHAPSSMGRAMAGGPPMAGIALAAWVGGDLQYEEVCDVLAVSPMTHYDALFVGEEPPLDSGRAGREGAGVHEYEREISETLDGE